MTRVPSERTPTTRARHDERGFTLVEVLVVVLVIAVLLGFVVPSLLGARRRAADAAARSSLDTAATAALVLSELGTDFAAASAADLAGAEPSLTYLDASQPSTSSSEVSVDISSAGEWMGVVRSDSDACLAIRLDGDGRSSFESTSCAAGLATDIAAPPVPRNIAPEAAVAAAGGTGVANLTDGRLAAVGGTGWLGGQWITFDFPSTATIDTISLWNRVDCCWTRSRDLTIFVSDAPIPDTVAAARASGATSIALPGTIGNPSTVTIGRSGRYVRIFGSGPTLQLREIEIVGILP